MAIALGGGLPSPRPELTIPDRLAGQDGQEPGEIPHQNSPETAEAVLAAPVADSPPEDNFRSRGFSRGEYVAAEFTRTEFAPEESAGSDNSPAGYASTESAASAGAAAMPPAEFDPAIIKLTFTRLATAGPEVMEYFYTRLFAVSPDTRALFPTAMSVQRERMFAALGQLVASLGNDAPAIPLLEKLARDHRRFGVTTRHYPVFFACLRDTVEHFTGPMWTAQAAAAWQAMLAFTDAQMTSAAERAAAAGPPWWIAEIISHELRSPGVAVIRLQPDQPLSYQPGQYLPVQVTRWPRLWRPYSPACVPRRDGVIELHVRAIPGGLVSNTLVYHSTPGDTLLLGGPEGGAMTLTASDRDLLCVAGGTGLAPIKAIIEQALAAGSPLRRKITLFLGARARFDLYDLDDLQLLESACPSLRVLPVLSEEPGYAGLTGLLPDVIGAAGLFEDSEAYICGPPPMVSRTAAVLAASIPSGQIHYDPF